MVVSALVSQALQAWIVEADSSVEEDSTKACGVFCMLEYWVQLSLRSMFGMRSSYDLTRSTNSEKLGT